MLSKESYEVLNNFPERLYIKDKQPIHHELLKPGYLRVKYDADRQSYYCLTDPGRAAVEEYERENRGEQREDKSLARATWANVISALALAVSIAALIVSLRG